MSEYTNKELLELSEEGLSPKEIGVKFGLSAQKVGGLIKKAKMELDMEKSPDEIPPEVFAKSSKIIKDASMGGSVVMTATEYNEYSLANGRYQGRKEGEVTKLDAMELRIAINGIGADRSGKDVLEHLKNKHGIDDDGIRRVAMALTKEEEISYGEVLKPLGLRP